MVEKFDFINEVELKVVIKKCAEEGVGTNARILLNNLCEDGKISLNIRDELAKELQ